MDTQKAQKIIISNEEDAANLLEQLLQNPQRVDISNVVIKDWQKFTIHLTGEKFHNSITPTVMKGFIELQSAIYEAFALAKYNDKNTNRLTQDERNKLEFEVVVNEGSSSFEIDVTTMAANFISEVVGKMSSEQAFILFLTALLLYFGVSAYSKRLEHLKEIKELELDANDKQDSRDAINETVKMLTQSNEKVLQVVTEAVTNNPKANKIYERSLKVTDELLKSSKDADEVTVNNAIATTGDMATYITRQPKTDWTPIRLDGEYRLLNVNSTNTKERKVRIRNLKTGQELTALLEDHSLDKKHIGLLGNAEWGLHPANLKVKAKIKNGKIKDAEIMSVESIDETTIFDDSMDDE